MEDQQKDIFFIWDGKKEIQYKDKVSPHILCSFLRNISFGSLFLAMEHANSIFHETWCNDSWSQKEYNEKEAAEIWSQQFSGFVKLYICVVLIDIAYKV